VLDRSADPPDANASDSEFAMNVQMLAEVIAELSPPVAQPHFRRTAESIAQRQGEQRLVLTSNTQGGKIVYRLQLDEGVLEFIARLDTVIREAQGQ